MTTSRGFPDVIEDHGDMAELDLPPLLIRKPLQRLLDSAGLGAGELRVERIGEGLSNVTFLVERNGFEAVLRRPPRPPYHDRAHDVLREARLLQALDATDVRIPTVLLACADTEVLGVPFYLMERVDGEVLTHTLPAELQETHAHKGIGEELVDALVELHSVDAQTPGLSSFGKAGGFLERQLTIYGRVWDAADPRRDIPLADETRQRLWATMPENAAATLVHGDYRLGNVVFARATPPRIAAILDWEVATIGDPLFDLGYFITTYPEPGDTDGLLLDFASVVVSEGSNFPRRAELLDRYVTATGRSAERLGWYMALANWRTAVGLEIFYQRHLANGSDSAELERLRKGVPELFERAWSTTSPTTTGSRSHAIPN